MCMSRAFQNGMALAKFATLVPNFRDFSKCALLSHIKFKHKGLTYACDQCDCKATWKGDFLIHIKSKHEVVKSIQEGVKYSCDQCDFEAAQRGHLTQQIYSKHEGIKFQCEHCDCKATWKDH